MTKIQKLVSLLLCACMLLSASALAETASAELTADTVLATVGGEEITWGDVESTYNNLVASYSSYYDMTLDSSIALFRAVALDNVVQQTVLMQKAVELGLDQLTEEEIAASDAQADADWEAALENYLSYFHSDMTDETPQEERDAANAEAIAYYNDAGYTPESLRTDYQRYTVFSKVEAMMLQDVVVTDEEVEAAYQALLAADKELYENDIVAYVEYNNYVDSMALYAQYYGSTSDLDHAWYKPEGFRAVKHILLPVDEELMSTYTDLVARYEEQQEATEEVTDPVTEEQINQAHAAILNSLADVIDEINAKIAEGADFDELIAEYAVNEDGTPTDQGMVTEPYKTSGYEVSSASTNYVQGFVDAAFSVDNIGDVSAPYLTDYGVHIVKYIGDVAGGPIAMTDEQREAKRQSLLETEQGDVYSATLEQWIEEAGVVYTGAVTTMAELEAAEAAEATEAVTVEDAEEQVAEGEEAAPADGE